MGGINGGLDGNWRWVVCRALDGAMQAGGLCGAVCRMGSWAGIRAQENEAHRENHAGEQDSVERHPSRLPPKEAVQQGKPYADYYCGDACDTQHLSEPRGARGVGRGLANAYRHVGLHCVAERGREGVWLHRLDKRGGGREYGFID